MLNAHFRPLETWPGERTKSRQDSQFKASYLKTLDLLEYELDKLRAKDIVVQIEDPAQIERIRNDASMTRGNRYTPTKPGIILNFESPKGSISMPCDRYTSWWDNLRAIALALEALRAVDRYGVTRGNEQYRGWTRLEAPNGNGQMDRQHAAFFIGALAGLPAERVAKSDREYLLNLLRGLKAKYHPDSAGTDAEKVSRHETFVRIGQAQAVLCGESK